MSTQDKTTKLSINEIRTTLTSGRRIVINAIRAYPFYTLGSIGAIFAASVLPLVDSWIYGRVFDQIINTVTTTKTINRDFLFNILLLVGSSTIMDAVMHLKFYFAWNRDEKLSIMYTKEFSTRMSTLDFEYFDTPKTNDLINKVNTKYQNTNVTFLTRIFDILDALFTIILTLSILLTLSPLIIVISVLSTIPQTLSSVYLTRLRYKIWDTWTDRRRDSGRTRGRLSSDESTKEIRIFGIVDYFLKRFLDIDTAYINTVMNIENKRLFFNSFWGIIDSIGFGLVIIILVTAALTGKITVGVLTFYVRTANSLKVNISRFFSRITQAYEVGLYVNDYFKLMGLEKKIIPGTIVLPDRKDPPRIEFRDVSFKYPVSDDVVLNKINLKIYPCENVAIVGENGAGKTTLIKLLMRFYDPTEGEILIDGINLKDIDSASWYSKVGTLFQEYNFYHFDAKTNIGVGKPSDMERLDEIIEASIKSGSHEFINKYENKYDQILDKSFSGGINPSTGQKQKIALARTFFKDAPILILDEPTSSIDAKSEYEIFEKLFEFAAQKTVIIISHRFSTVRNAQRIIVIDEGKIIEEGTHEDLLKIEDGKYKHAFELQKKGYQ